jgi:kumamolisin
MKFGKSRSKAFATSYVRRPAAAGVSYSPRQVAEAYNCPISQFDGTGVTVGIVELGGGYNASDLTSMGLPTSNVTVIGVDGGKSASDGPDGADGEVMLDIEVVASVAPGAKIRVYFSPNTDQGFLDAIVQAANECDFVSISWGGPESSWTSSAVKGFSAALAAARAKGVTVFVASGDSGSRDGTRTNTTDYPASDPSVVGCGGTRLLLNADGSRASEVVWDDSDTSSASGGGVSRLFPGRQVPDVAGNADPVTGYLVTVDGQQFPIGGTSAVAPLYAGMSAVLKQAFGASFDFLNTVGANPTVCFDVTIGDNGGYRAGPGRDNVTGLGVVDMGKLLAVLGGTVTPPPVVVPPPVVTPPATTAVALLTSIEGQIAGFMAAQNSHGH